MHVVCVGVFFLLSRVYWQVISADSANLNWVWSYSDCWIIVSKMKRYAEIMQSEKGFISSSQRKATMYRSSGTATEKRLLFCSFSTCNRCGYRTFIQADRCLNPILCILDNYPHWTRDRLADSCPKSVRFHVPWQAADMITYCLLYCGGRRVTGTNSITNYRLLYWTLSKSENSMKICLCQFWQSVCLLERFSIYSNLNLKAAQIFLPVKIFSAFMGQGDMCMLPTMIYFGWRFDAYCAWNLELIA